MAAEDERHSDILGCVKSHILNEPSNEPKLLGVGPVVGRNNRRCKVIVRLNQTLTNVDQVVSCVLRDGGTVQVRVEIENWNNYFRIFGPTDRRSFLRMGLAGSLAAMSLKASPPLTAADLTVDLPKAPSAELMGGDAIFNHGYRAEDPTKVYWGTLAFVASRVTVENHDGTTYSLTNAGISAAHVIHHPTDDRLGTYAYPASGITEVWTHADWISGSRWRDLALASIPGNVAVRPYRLRGFGTVRGTRTPDLGQTLVKFGSTTEISRGRELGLVWRRLPDGNGPFYLLRGISPGRFAARGDSGAAVVNLDLELAGLVVGGPKDRQESWYMPVLPFGTSPPDGELSYVRMELS